MTGNIPEAENEIPGPLSLENLSWHERKERMARRILEMQKTESGREQFPLDLDFGQYMPEDIELFEKVETRKIIPMEVSEYSAKYIEDREGFPVPRRGAPREQIALAGYLNNQIMLISAIQELAADKEAARAIEPGRKDYAPEMRDTQ